MKTVVEITRDGDKSVSPIAEDFKKGERGIIDTCVQTTNGSVKAVFIGENGYIKLVPVYALRVLGFMVGGVLHNVKNGLDYAVADTVQMK